MAEQFPIRVGFEERYFTSSNTRKKYWRFHTSTRNSDNDLASVVLLVRFDGMGEELRCEFSYDEGTTILVMPEEEFKDRLTAAEEHAFDDYGPQALDECYTDDPDNEDSDETVLNERGQAVIDAAIQSVWDAAKPFSWCDTMGLTARSAYNRLLSYYRALSVIVNLESTI